MSWPVGGKTFVESLEGTPGLGHVTYLRVVNRATVK